MTDIERQLAVFKRGAAEILPSEGELIERLKENRRLKIKLGVDPTAADLHLGHTVPLLKLRQLQELGHEIYFLIGSFTAQIGDPSGQKETRPELSESQVMEFAKTYTDQVFKVLDKTRTKIVYNGSWLSAIGLKDVIKLMAKTTLARILERDDFAERYKQGQPIHLHELLYSLLQGYDSVVLNADVEVGGTDQRFNLLMGRQIQVSAGQKPQICLLLPLLEGTDGTMKMSKTHGNYVGIQEEPRLMFGKLMSIPDKLMIRYFELLTDVPLEEIRTIERRWGEGEIHPKEVKKNLAFEITKIYHGNEAASQAQKDFERVFEKRDELGVPDDIEEITLESDQLRSNEIQISALINLTGILKSKSEIRRMIKQGGVRVNGEKVSDEYARIKVKEGDVIRIGKSHFKRIKIK